MKSRIILQKFVIVALIAFVLASCSKKSAIVNSIPKDAGIVLTFDMKSILQKGKFDKFDQTNMYNQIMSTLKSEDGKLDKKVEEIFKNPLNSGINLMGDMFFFMKTEGAEEQTMGFVWEMSNKSKLEDNIKLIMELDDEEYSIEKESGVNYIKFKSDLKGVPMIGWDDSKFMFYTSRKAEKDGDKLKAFVSLMTQNKENSIISNSRFSKFLANKKDISMWLSSENIMSSIPKGIAGMPLYMKSVTELGKGAYTEIHLSFRKGEILAEAFSTQGEKVKKAIDEYKLAGDKISKKVLGYIPKKSRGLMSFKINPEGLYNFLSEEMNMKSMFEQLSAQSKQFTGKSVKEVLKTLGGDFVLSLSEVKLKAPEDPSVSAAVSLSPEITFVTSVKDATFVKEQLKQIPKEIVQDKDGYYAVNYNMGESAYFFIDDNIILATNSEDIVKKAKEGGFGSSGILSSEMADKLSSSLSYMYLDLDIDNYPKELKEITNQYMRENEKMQKLLSTYKSIYITGKSLNETEAKLVFKDDSENSLYNIIMAIDEALPEMLAL